jgi:fibronectin type 3 domain-containing protein
VDLERNDRIISIQQEATYKDTDAAAHKQATYVVTALDRVWNESAASNTVKL